MIVGNVEKLVSNSYDKERIRYIHITLKQALNYGLVLKKCMDSLNLIQKLDLIDALI